MILLAIGGITVGGARPLHADPIARPAATNVWSGQVSSYNPATGVIVVDGRTFNLPKNVRIRSRHKSSTRKPDKLEAGSFATLTYAPDNTVTSVVLPPKP